MSQREFEKKFLITFAHPKEILQKAESNSNIHLQMITYQSNKEKKKQVKNQSFQYQKIIADPMEQSFPLNKNLKRIPSYE